MTFNIFYDPRQSVTGVETYSPSAGKPAKFVAAALEMFGDKVAIQPVTPITKDDLRRVHSDAYVDGVFDGTINNGFENNDPRVPEACLWTIGSLTSAVLAAPFSEFPVCSPTSGFHHAHRDFGGGFCTFNGLVIAAIKFIEANPGARVAILDLDWHESDGTDAILRGRPDLAGSILNICSGRLFRDRDEDPYEFAVWLEDAIQEINTFDPSVVIYQAGADMHKDDPLGGLLSDSGMMLRDRAVFSRIHAPLAWNLAGGYRKYTTGRDPVIHTHLVTMMRSESNNPLRRKIVQRNIKRAARKAKKAVKA